MTLVHCSLKFPTCCSNMSHYPLRDGNPYFWLLRNKSQIKTGRITGRKVSSVKRTRAYIYIE